jgi:hypothetical protein
MPTPLHPNHSPVRVHSALSLSLAPIHLTTAAISPNPAFCGCTPLTHPLGSMTVLCVMKLSSMRRTMKLNSVEKTLESIVTYGLTWAYREFESRNKRECATMTTFNNINPPKKNMENTTLRKLLVSSGPCKVVENYPSINKRQPTRTKMKNSGHVV